MPMIADLLRHAGQDTLAYRCAEGTLTFRELIASARRLAAYLIDRVPAGAPVGIYGHKGLLMPVCIVACAIANRPYLPIDRQHPPLRAARMLTQAKAALLLCAEEVPTVEIPRLWPEQIRAILDDPDLPAAEPVPAAPEDPFYLLFTSGSSGEPKGVVVTRKNVASFLHWERTLLTTVEGPVLGQAAFSFDLSVADLWLSLTGGRCESVLEQPLFSDYPALFEAIEHAAPTLVVLTPSFAELLLASPSFRAERFPALRELLFCGEPLRAPTVRTLLRRFPGLRVINSYGPTECTVAVTGCAIDEAMLQSEPLPIGIPKPGVTVLVTDQALRPLPEGEAGELIVLGDSVAAGYLGSEPGGFCTIKGLAAYRTGDLGYCRNGLLYCTGRVDRQIKWRGLRIEPGELEQRLLGIEGVSQVAVVPILRADGRIKRLRAFVSASAGVQLDPAALNNALQTRLPPGMIPSVTVLPQIPLTKNGKCDYAALKELP